MEWEMLVRCAFSGDVYRSLSMTATMGLLLITALRLQSVHLGINFLANSHILSAKLYR